MRSRLMIMLPLIGMLVAAIVALQPCTAFACSCMMPGAPAAELERSSTVFAGKVVSITPVNRGGVAPQLQVRFEVSQSWKGPAAQTIELMTSTDSASCGFSFAQGSEYVVYANDSEGYLGTNLCSRTRALGDAGEDLAALGAASAELPAGVTGPLADGQVRTDAPATPSTLPNVGGTQNLLLYGAGALVLLAGAGAAWFVLRRPRSA